MCFGSARSHRTIFAGGEFFVWVVVIFFTRFLGFYHQNSLGWLICEARRAILNVFLIYFLLGKLLVSSFRTKWCMVPDSPSHRCPPAPAPGPSRRCPPAPAPGPSHKRSPAPAPGPSHRCPPAPAPGPSHKRSPAPAPGPSHNRPPCRAPTAAFRIMTPGISLHG